MQQHTLTDCGESSKRFSLSVYPAASIPILAAQYGALDVIVNRGPTEHDGQPHVKLRIEGEVGAVFPPAVPQALEDRA